MKYRLVLADFLARHHLPSRVGTRPEGQRVQKDILDYLSKSAEPVVAVDLTGVELMNSSFSDEVLALPLQRVCNGEYGDRSMVVLTPSYEVIQDVQRPLDERDLSLLVFELPFKKGRWKIFGVKKSFFEATLQAIENAETISTGDLANTLGISPQNCSNRLAELARRRLIQRERRFGIYGGQTHENKSLIAAAG
jgi:hypothetical protein